MVPVIWIPFLVVFWFSYFVVVLILVKVLFKVRVLHSILNVVPSMLTFFSCELSEHHDGLHTLILLFLNGLLGSLVLRG